MTSQFSSTESPPRFLRPQDLRRLQNLQFAAKLIVEGFYAGRHRSPFHDVSAEFADYRPYVPGDDLRSLDWRAYARTDRDFIKLFRKDTDMRCHVVLDTSASMDFRGEPETILRAEPVWKLPFLRRKRTQRVVGAEYEIVGAEGAAPLSKFEYGAYLAAALCTLIIRQGDRASLALGANSLRTYLPPGGAMTHLYSLLRALEEVKPADPTDLAAALRALFPLAQRKGLLVVLSDFLEPTGPLFRALSMYAHRGWHILLIQILTAAERELPAEDGPQRYRDPEGTAMLEADPAALRAAYQAELRAFLNALEAQAKARRILLLHADTTTPYDRLLEGYLAARAK